MRICCFPIRDIPAFLISRYNLQIFYEAYKINVSKSYRTEPITKWTTTNTRWEATQRVTAAELTRLTHKIAIQLRLVQRAVPFAVLARGGQSGNFWIHPRIKFMECYTHVHIHSHNTCFCCCSIFLYTWITSFISLRCWSV